MWRQDLSATIRSRLVMVLLRRAEIHESLNGLMR